MFPDNVTVQVSEKTGSAEILIPAALLKEHGAESGYTELCFSCKCYMFFLGGNVTTVNILFTNLEQFLPRDYLERYHGLIGVHVSIF